MRSRQHIDNVTGEKELISLPAQVGLAGQAALDEGKALAGQLGYRDTSDLYCSDACQLVP